MRRQRGGDLMRRIAPLLVAGLVPLAVPLAVPVAATAQASDLTTPGVARRAALIARVVAGDYATAQILADNLAGRAGDDDANRDAANRDAANRDVAALGLKGWAQNAAGQYDLSEATYRAALARAPGQDPAAVLAAAWAGLPDRIPGRPGAPAVARAVLEDHHRAGLLFAAGRRADALDAADRAYRAAGPRDAATPLPAAAPMRAALYGQYGFLLWVHRRIAEVDPLLAEVETIQAVAFGRDSPVLARTLNARGILARQRGALAEAETFYDRALAIQRAALPADDPEIAKTAGDRAVLLRAQDRLPEAETAYATALAIEIAAFGAGSARVARTRSNLGLLLRRMGRYAEAEDSLRQALVGREAALGPTHPGIASTLIGLGTTMWSQGRYPAARRFLDRAVDIIATAYGPTSPRIAAAYNALATVYETEKNFPAAERTYTRALAALQRRYKPDHPQVLVAKANLASTLRFLKRFDAAQPLAEQALAAARRTLGDAHTRVGLMTSNLGGILRDQGALDAADRLYGQALAVARRTFGPDHPDVARMLHNKAKTARLRGDWVAADRLLDRAIAIIEPHLGRYGSGRTRQAAAERAALRDVFLDRVEALARRLAGAGAAGQPDGARTGLMRTAFRTLQQAGHIGISSAIARMAARFGTDDPDLAALVARRNLLLHRWQELDGKLVDAAGRRVSDRDPVAEADLRAGLQVLRDRVAGLDATLHRRFPAFADLIAPAPAALEDVQRLLAPDEAILLLGVGARGSFGYVVRSDRALLYAADVPADALATAVRQVRRGLSPLSVAETGGLFGFDGETAWRLYRDLLGPADPLLDGVTRLFIVPDGALQSLPVGVLLTEPPAAPYDDYQDFRDAPWLVRRYATTVIPSVSSLRVLRTVARRSRAPQPFFGIGDPLLDGHPSPLRGAPACPGPDGQMDDAQVDGTRMDRTGPDGDGPDGDGPDGGGAGAGNPAQARPDGGVPVGGGSDPAADDGTDAPTAADFGFKDGVFVTDDAAADADGADAAAADTGPGRTRGAATAILDWGSVPRRGVVDPNRVFRGAKGLADVCRVRTLAALPETADELTVMARTVAGVAVPDLLLRDAAREAAVRAAALDQYRIIAFATHGLVAGELSGLAEPALVLTPPARATPEDDGLLTASEIAGLTLDADLVVLSACNTASSDGRPGAPGLSGLAKSFLFAGARSLFVSHWPVVSDSTAALTRTLFSRMRARPLPPIDRLHRQAMLAMIDRPDKPQWSHPLFWAPFVVIGAP